MNIRFVFYKTVTSPAGPDAKESICNTGNPGSILDWGRSPGEGKGNPLQYLAWRIPWTEEPGGLQSMGSQRVDTNDRLSLSYFRIYQNIYPLHQNFAVREALIRDFKGMQLAIFLLLISLDYFSVFFLCLPFYSYSLFPPQQYARNINVCHGLWHFWKENKQLSNSSLCVRTLTRFTQPSQTL